MADDNNIGQNGAQSASLSADEDYYYGGDTFTAFEWSLFDDIDVISSDNVTIASTTDESDASSTISKRKRDGVEGDGNTLATRQSTKAGRKSAGSNSKRAKQSNSDMSTPGNLAAAPAPTVKQLDPEAERIRELLRVRARAVLTEYGDNNDGAEVKLTVQQPSGAAPVANGYDPLQYYRMMANALNIGCLSDVFLNVNQFFSPNCVFRCIAVEVSTIYTLLRTNHLFRILLIFF
jgi:hypothetical protein